MQKLIFILALALGTMASYAGAKIEWSSLRHDFGAFNESTGAATARFVYRNSGDEALVILGARANCGCTKPQYSAEILEPGDSATLTVTYDPEGRPGRFEKKIYVDSNTEPKRSTLTIPGVSIGTPATLSARFPVEVGPMRMAHTAALLGAVNKGHVKSVFESAYNASTDTIYPVVLSAPSWVEVKPMPAKVAPGEQTSFNFFISSQNIPEWDMVTDTVVLAPFAGSGDVFKMPVVITVNEDFSQMKDQDLAKAPVALVSPSRLEPVVVGKEGGMGSFVIKNEGNSPLKIRRIYTRTSEVKTDANRNMSIKAGKSKKVNVVIPSSALNGAEASAIVMTVVTNDPANPRTTVTIPIKR